ncbi:MAG: valyl-tRNA synthetase [Chlamydiota bacterium]|jgi:valyl-tRNA synthetase
MSEKETSKSFQPKEIESKWYNFWMEKGYFQADALSKKPAYCISIPPPNVTGVLHMGHALVDTLQDVLVRFKRMHGYEALWVPGTDHAGIATQTVVERHLMKTEGKRRKDYSREEFLAHVWRWKEESESRILGQLKMLGCSCDWSRLAFTMDEKRSQAVAFAFKRLFDAGLIYRGDYLVNWDPVTQTALADDEVEYEEQEGTLWYFRYPLEDHTGSVVVATTRPETMLGDTAVAVSPGDTRYLNFIGKKVIQPLTKRAIPLIEDHRIDADFGTGAVKITPAHDRLDYEIGIEHKLEAINLLTEEGKMNAEAGTFAGMTREQARQAVVLEMQRLGFLVKQEPYKVRVGISYRSKAVIEPFLSKQWFVRLSQFKEKLRALVDSGDVKLLPSHWENTYFHWIDNLRDWCISRQLWWGHRIPVWYHKQDPSQTVCAIEAPSEDYVQDTDVLDTWFSSALWPMSILGWPENTPDFKKFYPNSTLVTGHDILFFWVARMLVMGEYLTGKAPFPETFLHGLIYGKSYWRHEKNGGVVYATPEERLKFDLGHPVPSDIHSKWEKMSKSKGNVIDPLEIIDLYGADAMRMGLCASATFARQIDLDRRRFEEFKNFINKIWNGARFVLMNIETLAPETFAEGIDLDKLALEDKWILSLLNKTVQSMNEALEGYAFERAALCAYDFFWKEFCAYYVELVKPVLTGKTGSLQDKECKQKILAIVLLSVIRLMHPMAPFVTEEIFQKLKSALSSRKEAKDPYTQEALKALSAEACIVSCYPKVIRKEDISQEIEDTFAFIDEALRTIRHIRAEMQIGPSVPSDLYIVSSNKETSMHLIREHLGLLKALVRLKDVHFVDTEPSLLLAASAFLRELKLIIPLPEEFKEKERVRLAKEKEKLIAEQNRLRAQLANADFIAKAPSHLVKQMQNNLAQSEKALLEVMQKLSSV